MNTDALTTYEYVLKTKFDLVTNLHIARNGDLLNQIERNKHIYAFIGMFFFSWQSVFFTPKILYLSGSWLIIPYCGLVFYNIILASFVYKTCCHEWHILPPASETMSLFDGLMLERARLNTNQHNHALLKKLEKINLCSLCLGFGICCIALFASIYYGE